MMLEQCLEKGNKGQKLNKEEVLVLMNYVLEVLIQVSRMSEEARNNFKK